MSHTAIAPLGASSPIASDRKGSLNPCIRNWAGRRVWLVGASRGIGAAFARLRAARGARLALSARSADTLGRLIGEFEPAAREAALLLPVDVTDGSALRHATERIVQEWGGIDLVVWLAGTYRPMRVGDFDLQAARAILETNLMSVFNGLDALLPVLVGQGRGGLAIVSSVAGYRGLPRALAYGPSKAALINLAESLYLDLNPSGIGVWLVDPGFVETPLTAQNAFKMPGLIDADTAAQAMLTGFAGGRFEIHFPKRFTFWMHVLRLLPDRLYFRIVRSFTGL